MNPIYPTGLTAAECRARSGDVDASIPDCAELWTDEFPELDVKRGESARIDLALRYTRGEWRWLSFSASFESSEATR